MKPLVSLAALALALAAVPLTAQERTVVVGRVVDAASQAPLAAAVIEVPGSRVEVMTEQDGRFELRVRPGSHEITVARMGYDTTTLTRDVGGQTTDLGVIALRADPVLLEAINATVDRIERQRLALTINSRVFGLDELVNTGAFNAAEFVAMHSGISETCALSTFDNPCVSFRGSRTRSCVVVDDAPLPGGLSSLAVYRPRDFARINVYRRGVFVQAYTAGYLERVAKTEYQPTPANLQMLSYCKPRV